MHRRLSADLLHENIADAIHVLAHFVRIAENPATVRRSENDDRVMHFSNPVGLARIERLERAIILDVGPNQATAPHLGNFTFQLKENVFPGSPLFATPGKITDSGIDSVIETIRGFNLGCSTIISPHQKRFRGILIHPIPRPESPLGEVTALIDDAAKSLAAYAPPGCSIMRTDRAFGAIGAFQIIDNISGNIIPAGLLGGSLEKMLSKINAHFSRVPEALSIEPDKDNPNFVSVRPYAHTYDAPEYRKSSIKRLQSIIIRLSIIS